MDRRFYAKLFTAQFLAFAVSVFLNQFFFLKGTPIVQADVSARIATLPETVIDSVQVISQKAQVIKKDNPVIPKINPSVAVSIPTYTPFPKLPTAEPTPTTAPASQPTATAVPTHTPASSSTQPAKPTTQPTSAPSSGSNSSLETETINIINQKRQQIGLSALSVNGQLATAARRHSTDLNNTGRCDHIGSDGSDPAKRVKDAGYTSFSNLGETVGCKQPNPQALVDAWWASPGHHAILVTPGFQFIGMGWVGEYQTAVLIQ